MDAPISNNQPPEIWQVDVGGQIYETNFEELTQWIAEGSLLRQDKVKRGNLRWIEAHKVPLLHGFFNAKDLGTAPPVISTTNAQSVSQSQTNNHSAQTFGHHQTIGDFPQVKQNKSFTEITQTRFCLVHIETKPKYVCETCANVFCAECPQSFGGTVKVCPMCGAMCKLIAEVVENEQQTMAFEQAEREGFGFRDLGRALVYPFKFPASFVFGAIFFGFFSIGQQASSIGGRWLFAASIICWMMANMLTFGILANTVENMLQGKLNRNFMPSFDDFGLWDDVIHPLFLNISIYLVSFGAFIILCLVLIYFAMTSSGSNSIQQNNLNPMMPSPDHKLNINASQPSEEHIKAIKEQLRLQNENYQKQMEAAQARRMSDLQYVESVENGKFENSQSNQYVAPVVDEEAQFKNLNEMINQNRKEQLESTLGKLPEEEAQMYGGFVKQASGMALPILILAIATVLWGIIYLPVASIVAAYTRNVASVLNPLVGLDTIKRLGFDYVKILLMGFLLLITGAIVSGVLNIILSPFNLPKLGNIPAIAIGSVFTFYLSIVFSTIIGFALYKNLDKFQLYQNH